MDTKSGFSLNEARMIVAVQIVFATLFWGAAAWVTEGGVDGILTSDLSGAITAGIGAVVMGLALGGALVFRRKAVRVAKRIQPTESIRDPGRLRDVLKAEKQVRSALFAAWLTLQFPSLATALLFMMVGGRLLLAVGVLLYATGVVLTFPRTAWLQGKSQRPAAAPGLST